MASAVAVAARLVQKKDKVMEGRKSPGDTQTQGKVHSTNPSDLKMQCAGLFYDQPERLN